MKHWYASVNYGLEEIAGEIIKSHGADRIKIFGGGLTFYYDEEIKLKCVNNLFLILSEFNSGIIKAAERISAEHVNIPKINAKTFRVLIMDSGKLISIPESLMSAIEKNISRQAKITPRRARPDAEIWLNRRNDGRVYFMLRVNKHPSFDKTLKKGELRPDIVEIMIHEAKIENGSAACDFFGGWGSIAAALAENGKRIKIFTGDINEECVKYQKNRLKDKKNCVVYKWDAMKTPLENESIDAIVTDPPWGEYENIAASFYDSFINEARRVLKVEGRLVFLTSARDEAIRALYDGFSHKKISLKINGKEAHLFTAVKKP